MSTPAICLIGATGAVGKSILELLLGKCNLFSKLYIVTRRPLENSFFNECEVEHHDKIKQITIPDFDKLSDYQNEFEEVDIGICTLGTTKAKSGVEGFYKVDHDYIVDFAKLLQEKGCKAFHLVSSINANSNSAFFYFKVKGETENDVQALNFRQFKIYRPGVLLVKRKDFRLLDYFSQTVLSVADRWNKVSIPVPDLASIIVNESLDLNAQMQNTTDATSITIFNHSDLIDKLYSTRQSETPSDPLATKQPSNSTTMSHTTVSTPS